MTIPRGSSRPVVALAAMGPARSERKADSFIEDKHRNGLVCALLTAILRSTTEEMWGNFTRAYMDTHGQIEHRLRNSNHTTSSASCNLLCEDS